MSKKQKIMCGRTMFSNPPTDLNYYADLIRKTVLHNLLLIYNEYPNEQMRFLDLNILEQNIVVDNWYLDYQNSKLKPAEFYLASNAQYIGNNSRGKPMYHGNAHRVNSTGRSLLSNQTTGNVHSKPYVFILIQVYNYVPTTGLHSTHMIGAFKKKQTLYCFNPWGGDASKMPYASMIPDQEIWAKLKTIYKCKHIQKYTGTNLQKYDTAGACGVLSFTFGSHMYLNVFLQELNIIQSRDEPINAMVKRMFDNYHPAFGPVLKGLNSPTHQEALTSACLKSFQGCERVTKSHKNNMNLKRKQGNRISRIEVTNVTNRFKLLKL